MVRSVVGVIAGYLVFGVSAALLFGLSGRDPHAHQDVAFVVLSTAYGVACAGVGGRCGVGSDERRRLAIPTTCRRIRAERGEGGAVRRR